MDSRLMDSWTTPEGTVVRIEWDEDCPSPIEDERLVRLNLYHRRYTLGNSKHQDVEDYRRWKDGLLEEQAEEWCADPDHPMRRRLVETLRDEYADELEELELELRADDVDEEAIQRELEEHAWSYYRAWYGDEWWDEMAEEERGQAWDQLGYKFYPVNAYIHSGITISLGEFGCPWDSGQLGEASVSHQDWLDHMGSAGWDDPKRVQEIVEGIVVAYDKYLTGDCYSVHCEWTDPETGTTFEDSCGGLIGDKYATEEAKMKAEYVDKQVREFHRNNLIGAGI